MDRRNAMEWSWVAVIALIVLCLPLEAWADEYHPFGEQIRMDDTPRCFELDETGHVEALVSGNNACDRTVILRLLECNGATCDGEEVHEFAPMSPARIDARSIGLFESDFDDGDTFTVTFSWGMPAEGGKEADEGIIELFVTYEELPEQTGCGGCGVARSGQSGPPGGGLAWVVFSVGLMAWRRSKPRLD